MEKVNQLKKEILQARQDGDLEQEQKLIRQLDQIKRMPVKTVQQAYVDSFL